MLNSIFTATIYTQDLQQFESAYGEYLHYETIELDQYPPQARGWHLSPGSLPPGLATVSFRIDTVGEYASQALSLPEKPYEGRRVTIIRGSEGELIELVESA